MGAASLLLLLILTVVLATTLTDGSQQSEVSMGQERAEIALVAGQLAPLEGPLQHATAIWRRTWPLIDKGLPSKVSKTLLGELASASSAAQSLEVPSFLTLKKELFGPPGRIARLYASFVALSRQGWSHVAAAATDSSDRSGASARFMRENVGLYIESIYQASFDISQIGERVLHTYEHLGAASEFRSALTPSEVSSIAKVYSPEALELGPNDWQTLEGRS